MDISIIMVFCYKGKFPLLEKKWDEQLLHKLRNLPLYSHELLGVKIY